MSSVPGFENDGLRQSLIESVGMAEAVRDRHEGTAVEPAILLIDDNAIQAATRQTILRRAGYHVIAALNPMRALDQFRADDFPAAIRLVITDHLMPGMTGASFVSELRAMHPELPVLVISGLEEAQEEYAEMDVTFRVKPLLPDDLIATVKRLMPSAPF